MLYTREDLHGGMSNDKNNNRRNCHRDREYYSGCQRWNDDGHLRVFNRVMDAISNLLKRDNPNRLADLLFLGELLLGAAIGLIGFAKVLGYLLSEFEVQTMYWFIGLIAFSIPVFLKAEVKGKGKVKGLPTLIGMAIIFALVYFNPGEASDVHVVYPDVSVWLCVS